MKILLVNPDFPTNFWSFDSVVEMLGKRAHSPPLGLLTVAAQLPESWEVRLVDERVRHVTDADLDWSDVVLVGGMHVQCKRLKVNVRAAKAKGKFVVVGGAWVFHTPAEAFEAGADVVIIGEAEEAVARMVEAIEKRESPLKVEGHENADMTRSPVPRHDLLDIHQYLQMSIQTTRGCPFKCEFCDVTLMNGRRARTKTPEQVVEELQSFYDLGWRRDVFFVDDTFNANPGHAKRLLRAVIAWQEEHGYPFGFVTQCSVNVARSTELLELMVKAGFFRVFLGIESTEIEAHELAKKYQNAKEDLDEVCGIINEAGISIIAGCIVGFDNEPAGADRRFLSFAERTSIPDMFITVLQAPPGTDLWARLVREGREVWKSTDDNQGGSSGLMNFVPTRPLEEITTEYINLYEKLYVPENYIERLYEHFSRMKPLPFEAPKHPPSWGEIRALLTVIYRRGIRSPSRGKFWHYFRKAKRAFPDRFKRFLASLVFYEHLYRFRSTVRENVEKQVKERAKSLDAFRAAREPAAALPAAVDAPVQTGALAV